jgi:SAM-dependent methyltransferase
MKRCSLCGFFVARVHRGIFGLRCLWCTSTFIHRAVGLVLEELQFDRSTSVYELSSRGALFRYLKRHFPRFTYSEYFDDVPPGAFRRGIQCQDVQRLTYPDESFDLITSTEVFEHVPDDIQGYREVYRVLRRHGHFVFTVPLADTEATVERARMENGALVHLLPPEYHNDRIRGHGHVLAFRNYGMDIKDRLASVGFMVRIRNIESSRYAIANARVICCEKG